MKLKSSEPFWLVKNGCINSYSSLRENLQTDVLIIGGGITGSLMAHQCVADGYQTTLIDRREIGHGSTSATTSMLQYEIDIPLYQLIELIGETGAVASYRACLASIDELGQLVKKIRSNCGYKKKKSLFFAALKKDLPWLRKEYEARKRHGFSVYWLEDDQIKSEYQLQHAEGGILSRQGGSLDGFMFTHDLLAYNCRKGLKVFDKTNIKKIDYKRTGITALDEYSNTIRASKLIYCNGFESVEIIKDQFVKLLSTYAIVSERAEAIPAHLANTLFWNTAEPYLYLRSTDDCRLLIGGQDEEFLDAERRDALLNEKAEKLQKAAHRLLPDFDFRTDFAWAGTFGETKDGLPYIGAHPNFPSTFFVLGFGGNGITFSVAGMNLISKMLQGKEPPLANYFRFRR